MKKIFVLLLMLFVITGCDVSYNLNIDKDFVNENMNVVEKNKKKWNSPCSSYSDVICIDEFKNRENAILFAEIDKLNYYYNHYYSDNSMFNSNDLYAIDYVRDESKIGYSYRYKFNIEDYSKSSILNSCIEHVEIKTVDSFIKVHLSGKFLCTYDGIDSFKFNVESDYYTIVNDNSDSKKSGIYTWNIDVDGENDVVFELHDYTERNKTLNIIFICIGILVFVILLFGAILYFKSKRNNEI